MSVRIFKGVSAVVGAAALIAACTGSPAGSPGSSTAVGGGGSDPGGQASAGSPAAQGGGGVSSMSGCSLLTPAEIQQAIGAAVKAGTFQTGNPEQTNCDWEGQDDDTLSVGVNVQPYDDTLWTTMSSASAATAVSGLGEAAYKGYPHAGDLAIKQGGHEIDVAIVDFKDSQDKVDAAVLTLAKLVLSRV
jgi:hypothetical protein